MARSGESGIGFLRKGASKLRSTHADELDRERKEWREDVEEGETTRKEPNRCQGAA